MRCMNCGATLTDSVYCPKCGCDVSVQRQAIVLSGLFYNQGLEKAQVRDLSGSIDQLKRSLKFNKLNISARNLLGLVYFETGEVVAALSEWVISKNIQPDNNIASDYIDDLQKDANHLDVINQTIKKYNIALQNCGNGNEDVAEIQLKKILAQNPKLIKGYHLLSLLHMKKGEYEKARKLLKKAIRIDRTNTTTLRFLKEVDEQTGTSTALQPRMSIFPGRERTESAGQDGVSGENASGTEDAVFPAKGASRTAAVGVTLMNVFFGILIGAACVWFLIMPARTQKMNRELNERISAYSSQMAVQSAEYNTLNDDLTAAQEELARISGQLESAEKQNASYANLTRASAEAGNGNYASAWEALEAIDVSELGADARSVYDQTRSTVMKTLIDESLRAGIREFDQGNYAAAIPYFEQAKSVNPLDYETLNYLAHSYRKNGQGDKADETFREIIRAYPDSAYAEQAQSYIGAPADADLPSELSPVEATTVEPPPPPQIVVTEPDETENSGGDESAGGEDNAGEDNAGSDENAGGGENDGGEDAAGGGEGEGDGEGA